ncbi:MAG: HNH endonuclease signature motif containing protein, partial [Acholeplasma sp.]|nr:HNH endonuclease signature motif containing protein [Acholeplasma sp.]
MNYLLIRKYLTHSDISTRGKINKQQQESKSSLEQAKKMILYYDSYDELLKMPKLKVAAQSNIGLPNLFYATLGISSYSKDTKQYIIKNDWTFLLPKDILKNYELDEFKKILTYNKKDEYNKSYMNKLEKFRFDDYMYDESFLKFDQLTIAAHGLGTKKDKLLHHLRDLSFKGDVFNLLFDLSNKKLYLFFEHNEKYYYILGEIDKKTVELPIWNRYDEEDRKILTTALFLMNEVDEEKQVILEDDKMKEFTKILEKYNSEYLLTIKAIIKKGQIPKYRWYQAKWKEVLIKSDEVAFNSKGFAKCAISGVKGKYDKLGKFFIASHIKPYSKCVKESDFVSAFNPNNGLILSANIDALFDQYLISINASNGTILMKEAVNGITNLGFNLRNIEI